MDAPVTADVPRYPAAAPAGELGPEALMAVLPEGELASDYQWLSLHAWSPAATVSQLDGAMVVGFTDYHDTSSRFYGFCGGHDPSAIARRLLHDAERVGWPAELRLVPEGTACRLGDEFEVVEDRDNFDYLYDTHQVVELPGSAHHMNRKQRNGFMRRHGAHHEVAVLPPARADWESLVRLTERWADLAADQDAAVDEIKALIRCAETLSLHSDGHRAFVTQLAVDGKVVGFDISEVVGRDWALDHFRHTDHSVLGAHVVLRAAAAAHLVERGVRTWNAEQDLGVPGLRIRKERDRPSRLLRKYQVRLRTSSS
ncbi:MAG TPA: phosphatidylglycerol lysyltransferase domain-containing protein [Microthrixaceae bacterium]|nr:phosphatidylglycerol lysyltransferase domain-containing protein [Microthrixaceae bacterium]